MPLYEYECKQCRERLEKIQSFSAPHETVCPKCGGELERVISAPAIQFKGAGWYVNDYAKSGSKPAKSDSASKSDGKTDISAAASDGKSDSGSSKAAASTSDSSSSSSNGASSNSSSSDSGSGKSSAGSSSSSKSSQ